MSKRSVIVGACLALAVAVAVWALRSKPALIPYEAAPAAEIASRARIEQALEKHSEFHFRDTSLEQAIQRIADKSGIPILIDIRALEDASIKPDEQVTLDINGVSLRGALNQLLGALDLTWILQNETLIVTTPEKAGNELTVVVYPVHDLVMVQTASGARFEYQHLIDEVTAAVAPTTWDEVGGPGSIHELAAAGALVVSQTREAQAQVALLLTALRKARDGQSIPRAEANKVTGDWRQTVGRNKVPTTPPAKPQSGGTGQPPTVPANNTAAPNGPAPNVTGPSVTAPK
jgi:hypothetical protein